MEAVQKLKEGVFLINWDVGYAQGTYFNQRKHYIQKASAYIVEIYTSFELTCIRPATCNNNKSVFQLILKRNVDPGFFYLTDKHVHSEKLYIPDVLLLRKTELRMKKERLAALRLERSVRNGIVSPSGYSPTQVISQNDLINKGENLVPEVLEPSSVLVIVNGTSHVMQLENSTWNTEFFRTSSCACGRSQLILNVVIDFNSTSIITETKQVKKHLLNLWETKTLADVTFKFKEKEVQAHTLIVASGSPVLAAMFQHNFKEKQERVVVIKDSNSIVFEKMLHFFYTGNPGLDNENVSDLLVLANKYGVDSLKKKCALYMEENLTVDNVILYLVVAHLHESPNLYKSTLRFMSQNSKKIVTKKDWVFLKKNYHELSLAAAQMMGLAAYNSD